jgi:hypothetical protein
VERTRRTQELRRSNAAGVHTGPRRDNIFAGDLDPAQYFDEGRDNSELDDYSGKYQGSPRKGAVSIYRRRQGASMRIKNAAGFIFSWPADSDIVEVFYQYAIFPGEVFEAIPMGTLSRNESNLKQLANSTREYARL